MINFNRIAIFLAARSGSKRLPNKHFLKFNKDLTVIDLCILRLKKTQMVKKIFLCTTRKKEDNKFTKISRKHSIQLFRGSTNNVLKRFIDCAKKNSINTIVRITADCPFIDPKIIDSCIKYHFKKKAEYTSNILDPTYPHGLDVEVFKLRSLIKSQKISNDPYSREHVTSLIRSSKLFKKQNYYNRKDYSNRRWTLDYKKDFIFLKKVMKIFSSNIYFSWKEIIMAEKKNKKLINIKNRIN